MTHCVTMYVYMHMNHIQIYIYIAHNGWLKYRTVIVYGNVLCYCNISYIDKSVEKMSQQQYFILSICWNT